jgi:hypothetical protein
MSREHKKDKTDKDVKKSHKPSNIEEFVLKILERLNDTLKQFSSPEGHANLELPDAIGPETESVLNEVSTDGPITRVRKMIIIPGDDKNQIESIMGKLMNAREADINNGLRTAFAQIHKAKISGEVAYQAQAIRSLDRLISESSVENRESLAATRNLVLSGETSKLDAANFRLRNVFASRVSTDTNTRLAYTSLSTQFGEGYQLCPKSVHQIGKAIPMEISKCRDNCIDSRVTKDGAITCAYADWLRKSADNNGLVEARLERVKHNLNGTTLNKTGQSDPIKNWEGQLDEIRSKFPAAEESSMESTLGNTDKSLFGHQGEAIKSIQELIKSKDKEKSNKKTQEESLEVDRTNEDYDDETLEAMLEDEREPFTEQELEMMIEELLEDSRNKD